MSLRVLRSHLRAFVFATSAATAMAGLSSAAMAGPDDRIAVSVDRAKLVKLPERVASVVIGNPLIADITMQPGGLIVVTGKGYGATNIIAMDKRGDVLLDRVIQVDGPIDQVVTVYRGIERETYSCMPNCERRITLGDSDKYFKLVVEQSVARNTSAAASGSGAAN